MVPSDQAQNAQTNVPARDWSEIGRRIQESARIATAIHLAGVARRIGNGGTAKESPRKTLGG